MIDDTVSVTYFSKPLIEYKYQIDLGNKVFISYCDDLVLDFTGCYGWTFKVGDGCTFNTGDNCKFKAGSDCTFKTGNNCTFDTDGDCTFKTGGDCIFDTGSQCTFSLWYINSCTFESCDGTSTILDRTDNKHYLLTSELIKVLRIVNG